MISILLEMKYFTFFFLVTFFINTGVSQQSLPSVDVQTLDGRTVNIQSLSEDGKIRVFHFWATWCSPCKKFLDATADLYEDWQEYYNLELVAISIDTRRQLAKVKPIVETKGWEYVILSDPNSSSKNIFNFATIPQTYLVDSKGKIVYSHSGYVPGDEYDLEEEIIKLMED